MSCDLFKTFKEMRRITDSVIVATSIGKDALATLDVAKKMFPRVGAYFMYLVPGLRSQESYLKLLEARYQIQILRVPHVSISDFVSTGGWRFHSEQGETIKKTRFQELHGAVRAELGIDWVLTGEKKTDSLQRRGKITSLNGIDHKERVAYPVGDWSDKRIWTYINLHRLPVCPTYDVHAVHSWEPHDIKSLAAMAEHYPDDVERVLEYFPFLKAELRKQQWKSKYANAA